MNHIEVFFNNILKLSFKQILLAAIVVLIFISINKLVIDKIIKIVSKILSKNKTRFDDNIVNAIGRPLKFLVGGFGVYLALVIIKIDRMPSDMLSSSKFLKIIIVLTISMFLYNLTLENTVFNHEIVEEGRDKKVIFPFVAIIIRVIIVIVTIITIANEFGLTGFLTGLGISGIVVAFAAQDTCSNLFGGMMIVLDKPFGLGDWVKAHEAEGIVEEITFRSTRIRTFCKSLVTVPNSKLTSNNIINYSKRDCWRITFNITVDLNTKVKKLEKILDGVEIAIKSIEEVKPELIIVKLTEITSVGYVVFTYFYIDLVGFMRYEEIKEEINMAIISIFEHYDVKFAYSVIESKQE